MTEKEAAFFQFSADDAILRAIRKLGKEWLVVNISARGKTARPSDLRITPARLPAPPLAVF